MTQDVFRFWLEKGIDGILIDDIQVLFEADEVNIDEPLSETPGILPVSIKTLVTEDS